MSKNTITITVTLLIRTMACMLIAASLWQAHNSWSIASSNNRIVVAEIHPTDEPKDDRRPHLETVPIRDLRCGTKVLADNPELRDKISQSSRVDSESWRLIRLEMQKAGGGQIDIELLRLRSWVLGHAIGVFKRDSSSCSRTPDASHMDSWIRRTLVGKTIHLDLPELGAHGDATITAIVDHPQVEGACRDDVRRRLITGTFRHSSGNLMELTVEGESSPIAVTVNHPFWSVDRARFVSVGELRVGELLKRADGSVAHVERVAALYRSSEVYNLEVECEHVYFVGERGVLVHNSYNPADQIIGPGQNLAGQLVSQVRRQAGFWDDGIPLIIDSNNMRRGMAEALRARGFNAHTVREIFGADPGDPVIIGLAETVGGRVLTNNMADFGRNIGIKIDPRATQVDTWVRLIQEGLGS